MNRALVLVACLFFAGCAIGPRYLVNVSGLADARSAPIRTYDLWPSDSKINVNDLQFQEYALYVQRAMSLRGFQRIEDGQEPDVVVLLDYGIGQPRTNLGSITLPTYGQTGVSGATTTGTVNTFGNSSSYRSTTTFTPTYGVTGYRSSNYTYTTYTRYVSLDAFYWRDLRDRDEVVPAFQTSIVSEGSSGDLRRVFPVMIAAAAESIGRNTGQAQAIALQETDARVLSILGEQ